MNLIDVQNLCCEGSVEVNEISSNLQITLPEGKTMSDLVEGSDFWNQIIADIATSLGVPPSDIVIGDIEASERFTLMEGQTNTGTGGTAITLPWSYIPSQESIDSGSVIDRTAIESTFNASGIVLTTSGVQLTAPVTISSVTPVDDTNYTLYIIIGILVFIIVMILFYLFLK
mgnify:FL=1